VVIECKAFGFLAASITYLPVIYQAFSLLRGDISLLDALRWITPQRWRITTTEREDMGMARPVTL